VVNRTFQIFPIAYARGPKDNGFRKGWIRRRNVGHKTFDISSQGLISSEINIFSITTNLRKDIARATLHVIEPPNRNTELVCKVAEGDL
jgi:hypothetical protein